MTTNPSHFVNGYLFSGFFVIVCFIVGYKNFGLDNDQPNDFFNVYKTLNDLSANSEKLISFQLKIFFELYG